MFENGSKVSYGQCLSDSDPRGKAAGAHIRIGTTDYFLCGGELYPEEQMVGLYRDEGDLQFHFAVIPPGMGMVYFLSNEKDSSLAVPQNPEATALPLNSLACLPKPLTGFVYNDPDRGKITMQKVGAGHTPPKTPLRHIQDFLESISQLHMKLQTQGISMEVRFTHTNPDSYSLDPSSEQIDLLRKLEQEPSALEFYLKANHLKRVVISTEESPLPMKSETTLYLGSKIKISPTSLLKALRNNLLVCSPTADFPK